MRDLANVVTIDKVWSLEGKDKVQGASFIENGYEVMVGKELQPGDLVAFIQEGALLPADFDDKGEPVGTWAFLFRLKCYKSELNKYLIKVKKFKEIKSWGLCLKLSEIGLTEKEISKLKAGDDITELLHIEKYEPAEDASPKKSANSKVPKWVKFCMKHVMLRWVGKIWFGKHSNEAGGFPTDIISKSDETTIQNYKRALEQFAEEPVYTSCKMEGQSFTCLFEINKKGKPCNFYICSRNNAYKAKVANDFWNAAEQYDIENKLYDYYKKTGKQLVIQGEQCGPGIQQNIYNFDKLTWFVYSIKVQNEGNRQAGLTEMEEICKALGLVTVPVIERDVKLKEIMPDLDTAVAYAEKAYWRAGEDEGEKWWDWRFLPNTNEKLWKNYLQHEGVVVRTMNYDKDKNIGCSFKVKNIDYAEKGLGEMAKISAAMM